MPLTDFLEPAGTRVHAGKTGCVYDNVGQIWISKASIRGVDANLWGALKHCVDVLGIGVWISSIDTGKHARNSRHYQGRAVDIWKVSNGRGPADLCTLANGAAVRFANYLLANGFHAGERKNGQSVDGLLFGPVKHEWNPSKSDHSDHIHLSLVKRRG